MNNRDWELIVDKTREACRSWQTLTFAPRAIVYFKIVGTFNTANEVPVCPSSLDPVCVNLECVSSACYYIPSITSKRK